MQQGGDVMNNEKPTLECVTSESVEITGCHTDCGPFWND